jgi:formylmethanofuran dehydrogenase subunit E
MIELQTALSISSIDHRHLCPRQVLGVRIGLLAGRLLGIDLPQNDKRLLAIVETDGCFVDGVMAASGCKLGRRTMRIEDHGKVAAVFADTRSGKAVRIVPRVEARRTAEVYAPAAANKWEAQLLGYQIMPDDLLLRWTPIRLRTAVEAIVSRAGRKVICVECGEEVLNEREVWRAESPLCRACAGGAYYLQEDAIGVVVGDQGAGRLTLTN